MHKLLQVGIRYHKDGQGKHFREVQARAVELRRRAEMAEEAAQAVRHADKVEAAMQEFKSSMQADIDVQVCVTVCTDGHTPLPRHRLACLPAHARTHACMHTHTHAHTHHTGRGTTHTITRTRAHPCNCVAGGPCTHAAEDQGGRFRGHLCDLFPGHGQKGAPGDACKPQHSERARGDGCAL